MVGGKILDVKFRASAATTAIMQLASQHFASELHYNELKRAVCLSAYLKRGDVA